MQTYEYKLDVFEGPLDLLLHLIEKNKIDIYHIPIVRITSQYMEFLEQWNHFDIQYSSEFLVMAATLLQIKSRMLLPKNPMIEEEEDDPRDELVTRLLEFKHIKALSEVLGEKIEHGSYSFERFGELSELGVDRTYLVTLDELFTTFQEVVYREEAHEVEQASIQMEREEYHVEEVAARLLERITPKTSVRNLLRACKNQQEQVATFLAILELLKVQKIILHSEGHDVRTVTVSVA